MYIKDNRGFTLIELLAVIIVLAIILTVAVPRILSVVEEAEKESLRISAKQLLKGVENFQVEDSMTGIIDKTYTIENGVFLDSSIKFSGELPENGTIQILKDGKTAIAVTKNKWCIKKDFEDNDVTINTDINNCKALMVTALNCFEYSSTINQITITGYDNTCTKDVVIPKQINDLPVTEIGIQAFRYKGLTSVYIPNSVITINDWAFDADPLTTLVIPNSVTRIGVGAFYWSQLSSISIPNSVQSIGNHAFNDSYITHIEMPYDIELDTYSFSSTFYTTYVTNNNKAAGIYTAPSQTGVWTKQ